MGDLPSDKEVLLQRIMEVGFTREQAIVALDVTGGRDPNHAVEYLMQIIPIQQEEVPHTANSTETVSLLKPTPAFPIRPSSHAAHSSPANAHQQLQQHQTPFAGPLASPPLSKGNAFAPPSSRESSYPSANVAAATNALGGLSMNANPTPNLLTTLANSNPTTAHLAAPALTTSASGNGSSGKQPTHPMISPNAAGTTPSTNSWLFHDIDLWDDAATANLETFRRNYETLNASVDATNTDGLTLLHAAAYYGNPEIVNFLLQRRASVHAKCTRGNTPLIYALKGRLDLDPSSPQHGQHYVVVIALLEANARLDQSNDEGVSPLHLVTLWPASDSDLLDTLLDMGAILQQSDHQGRTPLHYAAECGNIPALQTLFKKRASLAAKDFDGQTPLHLAASHGHSKAVEFLLMVGVNPNVQNLEGETPLHRACHNGHYSVAASLLRASADVFIFSQKGKTAFQIAQEKQHTDILPLFLERFQSDSNPPQPQPQPSAQPSPQLPPQPQAYPHSHAQNQTIHHQNTQPQFTSPPASQQHQPSQGLQTTQQPQPQSHLVNQRYSHVKQSTDQLQNSPRLGPNIPFNMPQSPSNGRQQTNSQPYPQDTPTPSLTPIQNRYHHNRTGSGDAQNPLRPTTSEMPAPAPRPSPSITTQDFYANRPLPPVDFKAVPSPNRPSSNTPYYGNDEPGLNRAPVNPALKIEDRRGRSQSNDYARHTSPGLAPTNIEFSDLWLGPLIGSGEFGEVFKGKYKDQVVAVKKLKVLANMENVQRDFLNEVEILRRVSHDNICKFIGACLKSPNLCMVSEFCERGNLFELLRLPDVKQNPQMRINIAVHIARAMCYLHENKPQICHRDLKSLNILIDQSWSAKVTDFGMAKVRQHAYTTNYQTRCGTPAWMAPEVIQGRYSEKADVYSFGVIMWELLTCRPPYAGLNPAQIMHAVERGNPPGPIPQMDYIMYKMSTRYFETMKSCSHLEPSLRPSFRQILEYLDRRSGLS